MFRVEFSDNLNFRHLAKIESMSRRGQVQALRADRGQRILNVWRQRAFGKPKFHHARQIAPPDQAQRPQRAAQGAAL
jgi:hypothetical protein